MSECVVRMEMPKDCLDCPCVNGEYGYCQADEEERQIEGPNEIPSWCPIICSIPEGHGRLVDADELYMKIKGHDTTRPLVGRRKGVIEEKHICLHDICKQPTIVPEERRANDGTD